MPAHRKPTAKLRIIGAIDRNPHLDRPDDIETGEFNREPAKHLSDAAKACWAELVESMPYGVWQRTDKYLVELTAELLAEMRADPKAFGATRIGQYRLCLAALGLTPSDRSKLSMPEPRNVKASSLLD